MRTLPKDSLRPANETPLDKWRNRVKNALWAQGWSQGIVHLWYRPFPRQHEAGLTLWEAARELGFGEAPEETP